MSRLIDRERYVKYVQRPVAIVAIFISVILFAGGFFIIGSVGIALFAITYLNVSGYVPDESLFIALAAGCVVFSGWFWIAAPLPRSPLFVLTFVILAIVSVVRAWKERQWRQERQHAETQNN